MFKIPQKIDDFFGSLANTILVVIIVIVLLALFGDTLVEYQQWKMDFFFKR
jgi:hypothetical protein